MGYIFGYGITAFIAVCAVGVAGGVIVGAFWRTFFAGWLGPIPWGAALGIGVLFATRGAVKTVLAQVKTGWPEEVRFGKELNDEQAASIQAALERPGTKVH